MEFFIKKVKSNIVNRLIFFFSFFGLLISAFLVYEQSLGSGITCPIFGSGCQTVWSSSYSTIYGISLSVVGMVFYTLMLATTIWRSISNQKAVVWMQFLLVFPGLIFSTYLTYLEAFVIRAFCIWCLVSFAIIIAIFSLTMIELRRT